MAISLPANDEVYDLAVIGGGINGAGVAADAAGRGLKVLLVEAGDLAGATSSASSKLIHGGLRYLEQYSFRLVREALAEREVLLAKAPHIIRPLRFVLPQVDGMRPAWMLRAGLFLYDNLASRKALPASSGLDLARDPAGRPLHTSLRRGYAYWDCWVDDARLVVANAMAAREAGADIATRTPVVGISEHGDRWQLEVAAPHGRVRVQARALVNAAGPWVRDVAALMPASRRSHMPRLRLVKGSHIVVRRITGANDAYIFQNADGRVVFALPFEGAFTLIGTTDEPFAGDPRQATITPREQAYLLDLAGRMFRVPLTNADVVWSFAGVRPLDDDGAVNPSAASRDWRLICDAADPGPPIVHVIGGKITTYRRLAEAVLERLAHRLRPPRAGTTATAHLPGGDVGAAGLTAWIDDLAARRPGFARSDLERLVRRYGTRVDRLLGEARRPNDLGPDLGAGLTTSEVRYLQSEEWAHTPDDVLWRRTKTALHVTAAERPALAAAVAAALG